MSQSVSPRTTVWTRPGWPDASRPSGPSAVRGFATAGAGALAASGAGAAAGSLAAAESAKSNDAIDPRTLAIRIEIPPAKGSSGGARARARPGPDGRTFGGVSARCDPG
jgi:hypothetical protein